MNAMRPGVSFVVPVKNGASSLDQVLRAILAQADGRPMEVIAVDDGSTDGSAEILATYAANGRLHVLRGEGRGAAAAINLGIRHAAHPIICQVDQDVILHTGWMARLTARLEQTGAAAVQAYYETPRDASLWARVMGLDLEQRYGSIHTSFVDHVCTGNSVYRAEALRRVGLLDESLGYGYDNDLSYRLVAAGERLAFCREARSVHRWRERAFDYLRQQYGVGYGRLDVIARHPRRVRGDDVSGPGMILHAGGMLVALMGALVAGVLALGGGPWPPVAALVAIVVGALMVERFVAGGRAARRLRDRAGWCFAPVHLLRDVAWAFAVVAWTARRLAGRTPAPSHSMSAAGARR